MTRLVIVSWRAGGQVIWASYIEVEARPQTTNKPAARLALTSRLIKA